MDCVPRQNKLETPKEKDEVNKRGVHECDVGTLDPETMVVPPTPKSTYKVGTLVRVMSTITSKETLWRSVICLGTETRMCIMNREIEI